MGKMMGVDANDAVKTTQGFDYTCVGIEKLGATEYTIVQIIVDRSGSVSDFRCDLEKMIGSVVDACKKSPRAMNLLIRVTTFCAEPFADRVNIEEIHGFTILETIDSSKYANTINPEGTTPLFEATMEAIDTIYDYAEKLYDKEYFCNGIIFIITDGENNVIKTATPASIKQKIAEIKRNEKVLESLRTVLIGINDKECQTSLDEFHKQSGLDEYVSVGEASPNKLAKLADFVSQSVSSQSNSLGSGGPSQQIENFKF